LLVITHDQQVADRAERLIRIRDGQIEEDRPTMARD
jgi:predicted ABC-type transport system involved in lysophospholipase L1 biosynthesis ATPase subunit